jgi:hypothetical protein
MRFWLKAMRLCRATYCPRIHQVRTTSKEAKRWGNQCDNYGQDKLPPSADRWKLRSATYQGIADAMADQWGRVTNYQTIQ